MSALYWTALLAATASHLLYGLGGLLGTPPHNPANLLVGGQPGTGETPLEKLLYAVLAGW